MQLQCLWIDARRRVVKDLPYELVGIWWDAGQIVLGASSDRKMLLLKSINWHNLLAHG